MNEYWSLMKSPRCFGWTDNEFTNSCGHGKYPLYGWGPDNTDFQRLRLNGGLKKAARQTEEVMKNMFKFTKLNGAGDETSGTVHDPTLTKKRKVLTESILTQDSNGHGSISAVHCDGCEEVAERLFGQRRSSKRVCAECFLPSGASVSADHAVSGNNAKFVRLYRVGNCAGCGLAKPLMSNGVTCRDCLEELRSKKGTVLNRQIERIRSTVTERIRRSI